jgi:DNA-directed RNA polymerase specialized sigma subunit
MSPFDIDNMVQFDDSPYTMNHQSKISLSDLVNVVIESELNEKEKTVITKRYFEGMKLNKIKSQFHISNVYDVHKSALDKIYTSLKYVLLYNIGNVGKFDEAYFRLVSDISVREGADND